MELSFLDLREKEVINVDSGKKMGRIENIVFDLDSGKIKSIILPPEHKFFKKNEDIIVDVGKISQIGDDVILVSLNDFNASTSYVSNFLNGRAVMASSGRVYKKGQNYVRLKKLDNIKYK